MKTSKTYVIPLAFFSLMSCTKPYDFDTTSYEKVLVVDGTITDQEGPYEIIISYTYSLDSSDAEMISDATVWMIDGDGNQVDFYLAEDGHYSSPDNFVGEVNQSYQLHIEMADGSRYYSSEQTLTEAPAIDSLYGIYAQLPDEDDSENVGGIQFAIDTHDDTGEAKYFRYEWDEAYKIIVPYPSSYDVLEDNTIVLLDTTKGICYKEDFSSSLIYGSTIGSSGNQLVEFPVRFVSEETQLLKNRYTIQVKQYAISETAYLYYKKLDESNESGGSLFDQQTGSIYGNIYSEADGEENVLGFFEASGMSSKRKFFDPSDFDDRLDVAGFPYSCLQSGVITTTLDSAYYYTEIGYNVITVSYYPPSVDVQTRGCTDCSFYADTTPPDYWTDYD